MSSEASEQMLDLLKELSVYKAMGKDYKAGHRDRVGTDAYEERERRRQEITQEMQQLAAERNRDPL